MSLLFEVVRDEFDEIGFVVHNEDCQWGGFEPGVLRRHRVSLLRTQSRLGENASGMRVADRVMDPIHASQTTNHGIRTVYRI